MTKKVFAQYKRDIRELLTNISFEAVDEQIHSDEFRNQAQENNISWTEFATLGLEQFEKTVNGKIDDLEELREQAELDDERVEYEVHPNCSYHQGSAEATEYVQIVHRPGLSSNEYLRLDEIIDNKQDELIELKKQAIKMKKEIGE